MFGIEPRFDPDELDGLEDSELAALHEQIEADPPYGDWTEADFEKVRSAIVDRFAQQDHVLIER